MITAKVLDLAQWLYHRPYTRNAGPVYTSVLHPSSYWDLKTVVMQSNVFFGENGCTTKTTAFRTAFEGAVRHIQSRLNGSYTCID